ncbi:conserved hypothetical protein [Histoplasma capsulatum G186AR]|uniref:Integral membrane protein n=1 Tax=Ajellomyces capsulatus (strain G186AR / H82 / ATCC MYA-2454 / RMSCC 2432) TaxID=447093 RepID=C0NQF4_AJECG|nr:uncharacterized protein HCBG_05742 [Histoplasma capsulatum G186AR]EEH06426.1 conserved hypothetical protein [Histoplasma capsulatum G186AR]
MSAGNTASDYAPCAAVVLTVLPPSCTAKYIASEVSRVHIAIDSLVANPGQNEDCVAPARVSAYCQASASETAFSLSRVFCNFTFSCTIELRFFVQIERGIRMAFPIFDHHRPVHGYTHKPGGSGCRRIFVNTPVCCQERSPGVQRTNGSVDQCFILRLENHIGFHAIPAIVLAIDLLYLSPPWSIGAIPSMGLASIIAFGYWFWVEKCYQYNGWYPYPIFEMLTTGWRINLFLFSAILMTINTLLLKHLYGRMNGFLHPISGTHPGDLKKA